MPDHPANDRILNDLVARLQQAFGGELISVVLYGSAAASPASGDYQAKFSDLNVLCVLREITLTQLAAFEAVCRWWQGQGNPSPLLLTEGELAASTDCFAIEFHDMRRHHRILHGADVISGLAIGNAFYRAQVEHELRAKLLRLRQKATAVLSDREALRRLLIDSVSAFCVLFCHALVLHGEECGDSKRGVIERAGVRFGVDTMPFLTLLDLRESRAKPKNVEPVVLLGMYLTQIGKVIDAVDRLERKVS